MRPVRLWRCSDERLRNRNQHRLDVRGDLRGRVCMIYLDNAATTLHKPPEVAEAVKQAILTAGNASRGHHVYYH